MNILYSYGKAGIEGDWWAKEIVAWSTPDVRFHPFNHAAYVDWRDVQGSVQLDRAYHAGHPGLVRLHRDLLAALERCEADVLFVTNAPPYHPDFLRVVRQYKVLYSTDDPGATYERTIPYIHAYDHLMYCAPGYSRDMDLGDKLQYAGAKRADWLPLGIFDYEMASSDAAPVERDIDIVYVGACYRQKLSILAAVRRVFGRRARIRGRFAFLHNAFLVLRHGYLGWVKPVSFEQRVQLYRRAKIGFNIHWNSYGLGNQRLYHIPGNGAMQICDCPNLLPKVFDVGREVIGYSTLDDLLERLKYYLGADSEREAIATAGQRRVMEEYRLGVVHALAARLIAAGMAGRSA